jgi:GT2 family glycosyltransferase
MSSHRVTAILVLHDGATWLPEVVVSLTSQTHKIDQIVAVDTGSVDSSAKLVKGARIPVLPMDRETGFGEAISHAVSTLPAIADPEREWLWIIHDDLSVHRKALANLISEVKTRPNVVMAGPKLLGWHDRTHLLEIGISIAANGNRWTGLEPAEYDQGQRDGVHEVLAVSTAGALIRRDIFEQLGGFDPNLDLFRDDVDFGWRVHSAGYAAIAVSSAVAFHAEASANERRRVDVAEAFLHRPLLLDRRNAAYVLFVNSSWWRLPLLTVQLLLGSIFRAIGFLFAKLPGYASDEILAVGTLFIHPGELLEARKVRRAQRLVPAGIALKFIPSRWSQIRQSLSRSAEWIRARVFPDEITEISDVSILDENLDEEDLLTPATSRNWFSLIKRPQVALPIFLFLLTLIWSRNRLGSVFGGALPEQPAGVSDLWNSYLSGWHSIEMGTSSAAPTWLAILAVLATPFFGSLKLFTSILFFFAPLLIAGSGYLLLRRLSSNRWLVAGASLLYAISPVAISAVNSGRLSTVMALIFLPLLINASQGIFEIDQFSWRRIFAISLLSSVLFAFSPALLLIGLLFSGFAIYRDYSASERGVNAELFNQRLYRRIALVITPFSICAPWSFELLTQPKRFFFESGFLISGGGPNFVLFGNPGGPGSLPIYIVSPLVLLLAISLFSSTKARLVAELGFVLLLAAILLSTVSLTGHGTSIPTQIYVGSILTLTTIASISASVIMLDKLRERLIATNINFRHISAATLLVVTALYSVTSISWMVTRGANSPLQTGKGEVLPAFLEIERDAKTMVIRPRIIDEEVTLNYYIARGGDVSLGEPDLAPTDREQISSAVQEIADGSGLTASTTFAVHGVKYLFLKSPIDENIARVIDGLGGFSRASSTNAGIVWEISVNTGAVIFTDLSGKNSVLQQGDLGITVNEPGELTLTENYSRGWRALQDGSRLERKRSVDGMPVFTVTEPGLVTLIYDGTSRRAWVSFQIIVLVTTIVLALPAGRRRREIEDAELA